MKEINISFRNGQVETVEVKNATQKVNICYPEQDLWSFELPADIGINDIFSMFNAGSGNECKDFIDQKMRSLSVGDFVQIGGQWWECKPVGWEMVKPNYVIGQCAITTPQNRWRRF
jgi:hypothetical protein